jgi:cytochrome c553
MASLSPRRLIGAVILLGLCFTAATQAEELDMDYMLKIIGQRLHDENARQNAIDAGKERALLCQYCHGEDGNSLKPDVPNLAGQNAHYLLNQINAFANGKRKDYVMNQLAEKFTPEDKVNIAIFYGSMPVKQTSVDEALAAKGKVLFQNICHTCHGDDGHGDENIARLAGQKQTYIKKVLRLFRKNANNPIVAEVAERRSKTMEGVAKSLTDEQIEGVAEYVAQLP